MEFFKQNTKIDFMAQRKWAAWLSALLMALSILSLGVHGLNWGLDFTGGLQVQMSFPNAVDLNQARTSLEKAGFNDPVVVNYGTSKDILVTLGVKNEMAPTERDAMVSKVAQSLSGAVVQQVDYIGPSMGRELATQGVLAIVIALLGTMIYIALRFEYRFAIGSTVALIHDPVLILGLFSFLHIEFNLIGLAAVLTVIGYSLNDTIVIFDRVRENFRKLRKAEPAEVINQSINQTLSRTIMTSVLTLIVVFALFFMGGSMLHGFSLALIIGIIVGTYSSIYVAGSLALALGLQRQHLLPTPKEVLDERP